jgi:hypothetical protein
MYRMIENPSLRILLTDFVKQIGDEKSVSKIWNNTRPCAIRL